MIRKISNKQSTFKIESTKKWTTKPKVSRRKEIIKIRAEINKPESKKIQKINNTKTWFFEKIKNDQQMFHQTHQEKKGGPKCNQK